jgi:hypothetical protein
MDPGTMMPTLVVSHQAHGGPGNCSRLERAAVGPAVRRPCSLDLQPYLPLDREDVDSAVSTGPAT